MNNVLQHHGILGQKWGVRRFQNKDGTRTSAGKKRRSSKEDISKLSDDELRKRINRLNMENQYKNLTKRKMSEGEKFVRNALKVGASAAVTGLTIKYSKNIVNYIEKKVLNQIGGIGAAAIMYNEIRKKV